MYRETITPCVTCGTPMIAAHTPGGADCEQCDACGGVWIETGEFLAELRECQPNLAADELEEFNDGSPRRPCPRCGVQMAMVWIGLLQLDQCALHGLWFDGGELDRALGGKVMPALTKLSPPKRR